MASSENNEKNKIKQLECSQALQHTISSSSVRHDVRRLKTYGTASAMFSLLFRLILTVCRHHGSISISQMIGAERSEDEERNKNENQTRHKTHLFPWRSAISFFDAPCISEKYRIIMEREKKKKRTEKIEFSQFENPHTVQSSASSSQMIPLRSRYVPHWIANQVKTTMCEQKIRCMS